MPCSPPAPAAPDPARAFDRLDGDVAEAIGQVNAASARLVRLVREVIDTEAWGYTGCRSPEHWLVMRCAVSYARAHRLVRIARALDEFPTVAARFDEGLLTEDHLAVIVGEGHPSQDAQLADATHWNLRHLRLIIRALPRPEPEPGPFDDDDDAADDAAGDDAATEAAGRDVFASQWGDDGRYRGHFDVGAVLGALVDKAMRAARGRVFRERTGADPDEHDGAVGEVRGVDAFERLLHAALHGLDPACSAGQRPGDRYQALIHVNADEPERSRIHLGPLLSKAARDLLLCDAAIRAILWRDGRPVAEGRRKRVVDPILRALIEERDGGCRVCGRQGFLHIHHIWHWEDGGPTDPDNLIAVCTDCHRRIHAGDIRLIGDPSTPEGLLIVDRNGRPPPRPGPLPAAAPVESKPYFGPERGRLSSDGFL